MLTWLQTEFLFLQELEQHLQETEDKVNHLNKVKAKLEKENEETQDQLAREKKIRGDVEKAKRKLEGDLKVSNC